MGPTTVHVSWCGTHSCTHQQRVLRLPSCYSATVTLGAGSHTWAPLLRTWQWWVPHLGPTTADMAVVGPTTADVALVGPKPGLHDYWRGNGGSHTRAPNPLTWLWWVPPLSMWRWWVPLVGPITAKVAVLGRTTADVAVVGPSNADVVVVGPTAEVPSLIKKISTNFWRPRESNPWPQT